MEPEWMNDLPPEGRARLAILIAAHGPVTRWFRVQDVRVLLFADQQVVVGAYGMRVKMTAGEIAPVVERPYEWFSHGKNVRRRYERTCQQWGRVYAGIAERDSAAAVADPSGGDRRSGPHDG